LWDLKNNLELLPLTSHEEPINQVEFAGDNLIISASRDGYVNLWFSLSWKDLKTKLNKDDLKKSSLEQLQRAVWSYLNKEF
jgi:WD40 repeat protein